MAKTTKKKSLTTLLVVVLLAVVAIGGMLAYLTDRDSEVNTFTVGDVAIDLVEDYTQGSKLTPGVKIEKKAYIQNTGANDAWVWMTVAIPADVDSVVETNEFDTSKWTEVASKPETIKGVEHNVYTYLYNTALETGAKTELGITEVFLDKTVDFYNGEYYTVVNGNVKKVEGDVANTIVYVSGYAIQAENFTSVQEAYDAYGAQWGENGTEYAEVVLPSWDDAAVTDWYNEAETEFVLSTAPQVAGFSKLVAEGKNFSGKTVKLGANIDLSGREWTPVGQTGGYYANTYFRGSFDGQGHTISGMTVTKEVLGNDGGANYASGFFGFLDCGQDNTMGNVTFTNAKVVGHHWCGVAAGYLSGTMEKVSVIDSTVECTHANDEACGDKAGAVVGQINGTTGNMNDCDAKNCTVTAGRDAGQVVGAAYATQVTGCTATNVTVNATGDCTGANINNAIIGRIL